MTMTSSRTSLKNRACSEQGVLTKGIIAQMKTK